MSKDVYEKAKEDVKKALLEAAKDVVLTSAKVLIEKAAPSVDKALKGFEAGFNASHGFHEYRKKITITVSDKYTCVCKDGQYEWQYEGRSGYKTESQVGWEYFDVVLREKHFKEWAKMVTEDVAGELIDKISHDSTVIKD